MYSTGGPQQIGVIVVFHHRRINCNANKSLVCHRPRYPRTVACGGQMLEHERPVDAELV